MFVSPSLLRMHHYFFLAQAALEAFTARPGRVLRTIKRSCLRDKEKEAQGQLKEPQCRARPCPISA